MKELITMFLKDLSERFATDGCNDLYLPNTAENRVMTIAAEYFLTNEFSQVRIVDGKVLTNNMAIIDFLITALERPETQLVTLGEQIDKNIPEELI